MPQSASEIFKNLQFFALPEIASFIRFGSFAFSRFPLPSLLVSTIECSVRRIQRRTRHDHALGVTMDDPTTDAPRLGAAARWTCRDYARERSGRSNGVRAWSIQRWTRHDHDDGRSLGTCNRHAATCRLDAFTLGTPKWSDFCCFGISFDTSSMNQHSEKWDSTWASRCFALPMTQSTDLIISVKSGVMIG